MTTQTTELTSVRTYIAETNDSRGVQPLNVTLSPDACEIDVNVGMIGIRLTPAEARQMIAELKSMIAFQAQIETLTEA